MSGPCRGGHIPSSDRSSLARGLDPERIPRASRRSIGPTRSFNTVFMLFLLTVKIPSAHSLHHIPDVAKRLSNRTSGNTTQTSSQMFLSSWKRKAYYHPKMKYSCCTSGDHVSAGHSACLRSRHLSGGFDLHESIAFCRRIVHHSQALYKSSLQCSVATPRPTVVTLKRFNATLWVSRIWDRKWRRD